MTPQHKRRRVQAPLNEYTDKRAARAQRTQSLAALRGRKFTQLTRIEKDLLLLLLLEQAGLMDSDGRIR